MYCRKEMVKILKCYLIPKKSYGTMSKGAIFLANPVYPRQRDSLSALEIVLYLHAPHWGPKTFIKLKFIPIDISVPLNFSITLEKSFYF